MIRRSALCCQSLLIKLQFYLSNYRIKWNFGYICSFSYRIRAEYLKFDHTRPLMGLRWLRIYSYGCASLTPKTWLINILVSHNIVLRLKITCLSWKLNCCLCEVTVNSCIQWGDRQFLHRLNMFWKFKRSWRSYT